MLSIRYTVQKCGEPADIQTDLNQSGHSQIEPALTVSLSIE